MSSSCPGPDEFSKRIRSFFLQYIDFIGQYVFITYKLLQKTTNYIETSHEGNSAQTCNTNN